VGLTHPGANGLTISMPGLRNIPAGEELEIDFADADLHFFDAEGNRLRHPTGVTA
jgi:sn-glycerol 3-phosphate transport system ATP-binding protein